MAEGFGEVAAEWAARLPLHTPLIAANIARSAAGLACAAERRRAGKSIATTIVMPELRALVAIDTAHKLLEQTRDYDERVYFFAALACEALENEGIKQCDWIRHDPLVLTAAREFLAASDLWVTRSAVETQRLSTALETFPQCVVLAAPRDPAVPPVPAGRGGKRERIAVWAPVLSRGECAVVAFGLEALRIPVTIVCRDGGPPLAGLRAAFCTVDEAAPTLSQASIIVDATLHDAGTARALAEYGVPLVTSLTSGAHEWLRPVYTYAPWNARSIFEATLTALGGRFAEATRNDGVDEIGAVLARADAAVPKDGPLVTIVIPTFNRRERLATALASVAAQRYRTLEILVVNDGGIDVADIVARVERARLIDNPHNLGVTGSINVGIGAARGEYVGFLADDDYLQPDHVSQLVAALDGSRLDVAHSKELALHYDVDTAGVQSLRGHHIGAPRPTNPSEMLCYNRIGGPSMMFRRRALVEAGPFDLQMRHGSDFEMWIRLSKRHDFVFVNRVTAHVSMRNDTSQLSSVSGTETAKIVQAIFAKHPVRGRPSLERERAASIAHCNEQEVVRSGPVRRLEDADLRDLAASADRAYSSSIR